MGAVGIIANPASGKDIRRLVALGSVFGNQEKVNIVRRVLVGLDRTGVDEVYIMPDAFGIGWQAIDNMGRENKHIAEKASVLPMSIDNTADDSVLAAELMRERGVTCFVTLGGDGTNRVVAKGAGDVPIVPVSTGTNNVVPQMVEGTIAGLAAGYVALHPEARDKVAFRSKRLDVYRNGVYVDMALVDVAVVSGTSVGARAVWDPTSLRQIVVTRGTPETTGMSAIVGFLQPLGARDPWGMSVTLGGRDGMEVTAPLAPGVMVTVHVSDWRTLNIGDRISLGTGPSTLALDGEREIPLGRKDGAEVVLSAEGPWLVDIRKALTHAVEAGMFAVQGGR